MTLLLPSYCVTTAALCVRARQTSAPTPCCALQLRVLTTVNLLALHAVRVDQFAGNTLNISATAAAAAADLTNEQSDLHCLSRFLPVH